MSAKFLTRVKRSFKPNDQKHSKSEYRSKITRDLLSRSARFAADASPHVYHIDEETVVKTGDGVRLQEAATMQFVRDRTSIPVPRILDSFVRNENQHACIVMEYVKGETLDKVWPELTESQKTSIIQELKGYWEQLRSIEGSFIGCIDRTRCEDQFFNRDEPDASGPFNAEAEFREGIKAALRSRAANSWTEMITKFVDAIPPAGIVLTHNDFAPRNILIRDAKVVAIIDWELAGFYPEYWEYVKALFWPDWQSPWIEEGIVGWVLKPYVTELALLLHAREIIW